MKRVAVCLYGQPRTWKQCVDYTLESYQPTRSPPTDYFISTKGYNRYLNLPADGYERVTARDLADLFKAYNPVEFEVLTEQPANNWLFNNTITSMVSSINLCRASVEHYDVVVLTRMDVALGPNVSQFKDCILHNVHPLTILSNNKNHRAWPEFGEIVPDDTLLVAEPNAMFQLADALLRFLMFKNPQDYELAGPNVAIARSIRACNLAQDFFPGDIAIVRPHETTKTLYSDFDYHVNYWRTLSAANPAP